MKKEKKIYQGNGFVRPVHGPGQNSENFTLRMTDLAYTSTNNYQF